MAQLRLKLDENLPGESVTLAQARDLDFADIRLYRPEQGFGVIVLRPQLQSISAILAIMDTALAFAESHDPVGQLWVVEPGRVRVRT